MTTCAHPGCPALVNGGRCVEHQRHVEQRRGSARSRGYNGAWEAFREAFIGQLVQLGITPACEAQGLLECQGLHLDHEPPLTQAERAAAIAGDRRAMDDPLRVQLLCAADHSAKTMRDMAGG